MESRIKSVTAREILDSRGFPTVECEVMLENGAFTTENYAEFAELKTGVLSRLKCKKEITVFKKIARISEWISLHIERYANS